MAMCSSSPPEQLPQLTAPQDNGARWPEHSAVFVKFVRTGAGHRPSEDIAQTQADTIGFA